LNSGSIDKWRRYANSVRLRLLMRISTKFESKAQPLVMQMLNDASTYPLVDGGNTRDYSPLSSDILLRPLTNFTSSLVDAMFEIDSYFAPDYMLNKVMNPANDPRIPVLFDKFGTGVGTANFVQNPTYRAMPVTYTGAQADAEFQNYAIIDSATIWRNTALPGLVVTAPEVNLLKAEALERWGSTSAAETAYETGVGQSVTFYYYLNSISSGKKETMPSASVIDQFINNSTISYSGSAANKLTLIGTQKWLHYGFLQAQHAWAEYRRTGVPALTIVPASAADFTLPPNRLLYPSAEKTNNAANYQEVQAEDKRTTKIFWMP
ncbi:MAG: SusD/RagB family nutrient-binding outer membrane lipoprotein, partial [Sphingobacteriales bacterium]